MKKLALALMAGALVSLVATAAFAAPAVYTVKKAAAPVVADGNLKEFAGVTPITFSMPDGGAVKVQAMWDETALYFAFTIGDKVQSNAFSGGNIWQGDGVQISLDPKNDKTVGSYGSDDYEFGFALTKFGWDANAWKIPAGVKFDAKAQKFAAFNSDGQSIYEIILPAAQIAGVDLKAGTTFGANVLVNDEDGKGREWQEWTPGIGTSKDPSQYNNFTLGQ